MLSNDKSRKGSPPKRANKNSRMTMRDLRLRINQKK